MDSSLVEAKASTKPRGIISANSVHACVTSDCNLYFTDEFFNHRLLYIVCSSQFSSAKSISYIIIQHDTLRCGSLSCLTTSLPLLLLLIPKKKNCVQHFNYNAQHKLLSINNKNIRRGCCELCYRDLW